MGGRNSLARRDIHEPVMPAPLALVGGAAPAEDRAVEGSATVPAGSPVDELLTAWETDARCLECGRRIDTVTDAALLVGPMRVAHREGCFVPALLRLNPQLHLMSSSEHPSVLPLDDAGDREPHRG